LGRVACRKLFGVVHKTHIRIATSSAHTVQLSHNERGLSRLVCYATPDVYVETVSSAAEAKAQLDGSQLQAWEACAEQLKALGFTAEDADRLLAKGFAWTTRSYWGFDKANEVPAPSQVSTVLQYLQGTLNISGADLMKVIKMFPEVLACSIEGRLAPNVGRLQKEWFMAGDALTKSLVRKPSLLGLSVDCSAGGGGCQGMCSKCWAAN